MASGCVNVPVEVEDDPDPGVRCGCDGAVAWTGRDRAREYTVGARAAAIDSVCSR